jgi:hypothetical protein
LRGHLEDEVLDFDCVPHGKYLRIIGLKILIHANAATRSNIQSRVDRQSILRSDSDSQDHNSGDEPPTRFQPDDNVPV